MQKCAVPPRGTARKGPTIRWKRFPGRGGGLAEVTVAPARPGLSRSRSVLRKKSRGRSIQHQSCAHRTGKEADRQTCRLVSMQPCCGSGGHPQRPAIARSSDQPCRLVPGQMRGLSPMQACRHANRHTGRTADGRDCGHALGRLRRCAAALWLRESLRNMKARALCYNFQHIPFDVPATICLNGAPDAGRISEAFTMASLGLGLRSAHRLP